MAGGRAGCGEFDHDIAVADQFFGVVTDRDAAPADSGEFADVLIDVAAARLGTAAGERTPFARHDLCDQHPTHSAAAPDDPHLGPRHLRLLPASCGRNGYRS